MKKLHGLKKKELRAVIERRALKDPKWRITGFVQNLEREGIPL